MLDSAKWEEHFTGKGNKMEFLHFNNEYHTTDPKDVVVGRTRVGAMYWTVFKNDHIAKTFWCLHENGRKRCATQHWGSREEPAEKCWRCGAEIPKEILFLFKMCMINV